MSAGRSRARTASTPSGATGPKRRGSPAECRATASLMSCCRRARRPVRSLSPEETALWARVASTIRPLSREKNDPEAPRPISEKAILVRPNPASAPARPAGRQGVGTTLDRKLGQAPRQRRCRARSHRRFAWNDPRRRMAYDRPRSWTARSLMAIASSSSSPAISDRENRPSGEAPSAPLCTTGLPPRATRRTSPQSAAPTAATVAAVASISF